jgi:hypothetical protein
MTMKTASETETKWPVATRTVVTSESGDEARAVNAAVVVDARVAVAVMVVVAVVAREVRQWLSGRVVWVTRATDAETRMRWTTNLSRGFSMWTMTNGDVVAVGYDDDGDDWCWMKKWASC